MTKADTKQTRGTPARREPRHGSTMWAAIQVLGGKRKPMTATEIYTEIGDRELQRPRSGATSQNAGRGKYHDDRH
jgi:hypothetical protein